jgi:hypothetical protein
MTRFDRLRRVPVVAAMVLCAVNLWTGAPLLAIWTGAQVVPSSGLSMAAVGVVVVVLAIACLALVSTLTWLGALHDRLTGRPPPGRRQAPWMRAMSGERPHQRAAAAPPLRALDYVLVGAVVAAVLAFEVWFFFFAGSSLGSG